MWFDVMQHNCPLALVLGHYKNRASKRSPGHAIVHFSFSIGPENSDESWANLVKKKFIMW